MFAKNNDTVEVGLVTDKPIHRVNRNYYTVRSYFTFMDRIKRLAEKYWEKELYFQRDSYGHIMHYKVPGQGLQWHAEPNIATVSVSINLSPDSEYEGADFEIKGHDVELPEGAAVFYSSNLMHRVTPLISGHKKSFVVWLPTKEQRKK